MKKLPAILAAAAILGGGGLPATAQATAAFGTLSFVQPTGTAGPNDVIDVYLRLTLDANSATLSVDEFGAVTSGGPSLTELTDAGIDVNQPYGIGLAGYLGCSGTFVPPGCGPAEYEYAFQSPPADFTLSAGESLDFLWLTFTPFGGPAAAGTYKFYETAMTIGAYGVDSNGDSKFPAFDAFGMTCASGDDRCAFSRTVSSGGGGGGGVPEPTTWALLIGGFALAGTALRAQRRRVAAT
ncbi:MAG: PEPxxWA-CTERM sorting domain-containing protein [Phenylobacterium sp.]|uniref:PEPxxWA-CTERM sorting domain-containing protein n=1 Tax=Phenylobacterium sp. TaxID=1871053 RepID=UPI001A3FFA72|nr:PEPxxWA-CTERM sorting domain-containing protein [Phenylobacterium sp.]MBL8555570.1 PEPxxWA-CTERM sorting domain-containing protein [Phenylobacterium sp.]